MTPDGIISAARVCGLHKPEHHTRICEACVRAAIEVLTRLLINLTLAVGDDPACKKLTVPCTCGKAAQLTAAHAEAARVVRANRKRENTDG